MSDERIRSLNSYLAQAEKDLAEAREQIKRSDAIIAALRTPLFFVDRDGRYRLVTSVKRVRHLKRGSTYSVLGEAEVQASAPIVEGDRVTVYRCEADGRVWARPVAEFEDGRFEKLEGSHD